MIVRGRRRRLLTEGPAGDTRLVNRTRRTALAIAGASIEILIALAWWWRPEHALEWGVAAGFVLVIAAIVEHGAR